MKNMKTNYYERLIDVEALKSFDGLWYLKITYEYTDGKGKHIRVFPKVAMPFDSGHLPDIVFGSSGKSYLCLPNDHLELYRDQCEAAKARGISDESAVFDIITEPVEPKEMTLAEIEEKLGYKVKIVSKEEK